MDKTYLKIGKSSDLKTAKERFIYRVFEIFPGALSWLTLALMVILSRFQPVFVAFFITSFVIYWFIRTVYLSFHLRAGFKQMKINEKTDWLLKLEKNENWQRIYHLIILPMYKEPLEIIRETFLALKNSQYPKDKMIIALGCEERADSHSQAVAKAIEKEFGRDFFQVLITFHPADLPGEIAGKGSNETWTARKAKEIIIDPLKIPYTDIIVSSLDADTKVFPHYFGCLSHHYLTAKNPTKTSFQPIPLFINNIWQTPLISRIFSFSSTFWHTMNQERPEKLITFSSHSMSFQALLDVDFRQTNIVSDDSRIFWQCFFRYNGDYRVQPLFYPVAMDANCAKTTFQTLKNIYKQQRRWAYGVSDIPYFLFGFLKNRQIPLSRKFILGWELIEGHWSWATSSILIFALGWLPIWLGAGAFPQTVLSYNLPKIISQILTISMAGLIISIYFSLILLPPKPLNYGRAKYFVFALSWVIFPLMMIIFSALPALDAQTRLMLGKYMGFWPTEKIRK